MASQVEKPQHLNNQVQEFKCPHIYEEANFVADLLSKFSYKIDTYQIYFDSKMLPEQTKAY